MSSLFFVADECCYYYRFFPDNLNCNPKGRPSAVVLGCSIYSPDGSDVTVRWYRSTQEHLTRVQGKLVTNGHDSIDNTRRDLDISHHIRFIENFNESLNGLYWCQIEVNNTCLQPSPYGRIIFNSSSENDCKNINTPQHHEVRPACAMNNSNMSCQSTMTSSDIVTPTTSYSDESFSSMGPYNLDIMIGAPVGAVMVCILLVILLVVIILFLIKRKRKNEIMSHSATLEYEIQSRE